MQYNGESIANGGGDNAATTFGLSTDEDLVLLGCNDMMATNYNELAVANDGSLEYPTSETCTDEVNAAYESGFDAGAASITPEDGISQADVDFAVAEAASEILAPAQLADALADCDDDGMVSDVDLSLKFRNISS